MKYFFDKICILCGVKTTKNTPVLWINNKLNFKKFGSLREVFNGKCDIGIPDN